MSSNKDEVNNSVIYIDTVFIAGEHNLVNALHS